MDGGEAMLVIGVGTTSRVTIADVLDLIAIATSKIGKEHSAGLGLELIAALDRLDINPVLQEAARRAGLPIKFLAADALRAAAPRCATHSEKSMKAYGVPSVAEAAALVALDAKAKLLIPRFCGRNTTASVAYLP
jgi:cobalamin biosynthesis protein CbiG